MIKMLASFYLFCLGGAAFGVLFAGAVVAPIIFHSELIFGVKMLSRFEAGLMMSEIFSRFNYILLTTAALIVAFEGFLAVNKKSSPLMMVLSIVNISAIGLYAFVFTPQIIGYQALGERAISSSEFDTIHRLAELDFKILLITLTVSFFVRFSKIGSVEFLKEK